MPIKNATKKQVAQHVNSSLVLLYWKIGQRIHVEILKEARAEYGEKIIQQLANKLTLAYGRGFSARAIFRMVRFAKMYPDEQIVTTLSALLSWSQQKVEVPKPLMRLFPIIPNSSMNQNRHR